MPRYNITLAGAIISYHTALIAQNKSPKTIKGYLDTINQLQAHLAATDIQLRSITTEDVEQLLVQIAVTPHHRTGKPIKPATLSYRYRALKTFFNWTTRRNYTRTSPMKNMTPPHVPTQPPAVLDDLSIKRLLKTCTGRNFYARRDQAIIRILLDDGIRRNELATLKLEDVDLNGQRLKVLGKGSIHRYVPLGTRATNALKQYITCRALQISCVG